MLLWVIIKTTDNGTKCLLTGLAIILCNQDRWEHYKLQINPFNNEGQRCAHPVASIVAWATCVRGVLQQLLCELWLLDETLHERETRFDFEQNKHVHAIQPVPKQAKRAMSLSRIQPSSSALWEHAYSACLTRTNDGPPSAYMLTAVSCPHPGNDCVINPELLFKLLLTAEGENGINCLCSPVTTAPLRTVWATLAIRHCQRRTWDGVGLHMQRPQSGLQEPDQGMFYHLSCCWGCFRLLITSQFVYSKKQTASTPPISAHRLRVQKENS